MLHILTVAPDSSKNDEFKSHLKRQSSIEITHSHHGEEAKRLIKQRPFEAILVDGECPAWEQIHLPSLVRLSHKNRHAALILYNRQKWQDAWQRYASFDRDCHLEGTPHPTELADKLLQFIQNRSPQVPSRHPNSGREEWIQKLRLPVLEKLQEWTERAWDDLEDIQNHTIGERHCLVPLTTNSDRQRCGIVIGSFNAAATSLLGNSMVAHCRLSSQAIGKVLTRICETLAHSCMEALHDASEHPWRNTRLSPETGFLTEGSQLKVFLPSQAWRWKQWFTLDAAILSWTVLLQTPTAGMQRFD